MYNIIYIAIFLFLIPTILRILQAMRIEQIFQKSKIGEIRLFYIFVSLIMAKLVTDSLFVLLEKVNEIVS